MAATGGGVCLGLWRRRGGGGVTGSGGTETAAAVAVAVSRRRGNILRRRCRQRCWRRGGEPRGRRRPIRGRRGLARGVDSDLAESPREGRKIGQPDRHPADEIVHVDPASHESPSTAQHAHRRRPGRNRSRSGSGNGRRRGRDRRFRNQRGGNLVGRGNFLRRGGWSRHGGGGEIVRWGLRLHDFILGKNRNGNFLRRGG